MAHAKGQAGHSGAKLPYWHVSGCLLRPRTAFALTRQPRLATAQTSDSNPKLKLRALHKFSRNPESAAATPAFALES